MLKKTMPKLIADDLICIETLKHSGVLTLTEKGLEAAKMNSLIKTPEFIQSKITVISDGAKLQLAGLNPERFPETPLRQGDEKHLGIISGTEISDLIRKTVFAATKEQSSFTFGAVALEFGKTGTRTISTDGHRLNLVSTLDFTQAKKVKTEYGESTPNHLLNLDGAKVLHKIINGKVLISSDENNLYFKTNFSARTLSARIPSGRFPSYEMVLPKDTPFEFDLHAKETAPVVSAALQFADERTKSIAFQPYYNHLIFKTNGDDTGYTGKASCDFPQSSAPACSVNGQHLLDAIANTDGETLRVKYKNSNSQFEIVGKNNLTEYRFVIMPLNAGENADDWQIITDEEKAELKLIPFYKDYNGGASKPKASRKETINEIRELLGDIVKISAIDGLPRVFADAVTESIAEIESKLNSL